MRRKARCPSVKVVRDQQAVTCFPKWYTFRICILLNAPCNARSYALLELTSWTRSAMYPSKWLCFRAATRSRHHGQGKRLGFIGHCSYGYEGNQARLFLKQRSTRTKGTRLLVSCQMNAILWWSSTLPVIPMFMHLMYNTVRSRWLITPTEHPTAPCSADLYNRTNKVLAFTPIIQCHDAHQ